jgi:ABC-type lipoprotein export system ATPase subunit
VIVTHDPGVGAQCDRIVRMRDGEMDHSADHQQSVTMEAITEPANVAAD